MKVQLRDLPIRATFLDPETDMRFEIREFDSSSVLAAAGEGDTYEISGSAPRSFAGGDVFPFNDEFEVELNDVEYPVCEFPEKCLERFATQHPEQFRKALDELNIKQD